MFTISVSGYVASMRRNTTRNGKEMLVLRFSVKTPVMNESMDWVDRTFWCEATAWGEKCDQWERLFKVGDAIEVTGRFNYDIFNNPKTGTTSETVIVYGMEGSTPNIRYAIGKSGGEKPAEGGGQRPERGQQQGGRYRNSAQQAPTHPDDDLGEIPF